MALFAQLLRPCARPTAVGSLLAAALLLAACEKPDASHLTSPSAESLVGTSSGNVALSPPERAPDAVAPPPGWNVVFETALFTELENGTDSLRIILSAQTQAGKGFEVWLSNDKGAVARWSGGSSQKYNGVVCFQIPLTTKTKDKATGVTTVEATPLDPGNYHATIVFRDVDSGPVVSQVRKVTGQTPKLKGAVPGPKSDVFRLLLGCPRGT